MSVTRIFRRRAGVLGNPAPNERTMMMESPLLAPDVTASEPIDVRAQFIDRYPVIKRALEHHRKQGVLIAAFDDQTISVGHVWLKASLDRTRCAIVGRHSMCSLAVPQEYTEISLRHLVVLVRATSHDEVRIRVADLATPGGFRDEQGRVLQAVACDGPMFARIGRVLLMLLVTDGESPIPERAEDAYDCIPPRVFVEERTGTAGTPPKRAPSGAVGRIAPGATLIKSRPGPLVAVGELLQQDEAACGALVIKTGGGAVRKSVGDAALERGILFGRYARCDVGATFDEDSRLSRVHFMVTRVGGEVVGIDTASTNGSFQDGRAMTLKTLDEGEPYDLAGEIELMWQPE